MASQQIVSKKDPHDQRVAGGGGGVGSTIIYSSSSASRSASSTLSSTGRQQLQGDGKYSPHFDRAGSESSQPDGGQKRVVYSAPLSHQSGSNLHQAGAAPAGGGTSSSSRVHKIVSEVEEYQSLFGQDAAQFVVDTRERERRELHELNDRLAAYLERMRLLELQNKDLEALRARWAQDVANVKSAYERELSETQRDLEGTARDRALLEAQIGKLQAELNDLRKKFDDAVRSRDENKAKVEALLRQLNDAENEMNKLSRRVQALEDEVARLKNENARLQAELQKVKADLDRESLKGIEYQNQIQALLKKIESMRREYEQEVTELRSMETMVINDQYKDDLANAIRDIRKEFDSLADQNKNDLESWYVRKVQEVQVTETNQYRDETNRLSNELDAVRNKILDLEALNGRLNREIQDLEKLLQHEKFEYESTLSVSESHIRKMLDENRSLQEKLRALFETNQNLYAEIAIYRKLLDSEELYQGSRVVVGGAGGGGGGGKIVSSHLSSADDLYDSRGSQSPSKGGRHQFGGRVVPSSGSYVSKQETSSQSNFQRASKGCVQFADISPEGKFIVLENLSLSRDEPMGDWKLVRLLDNKREMVFTFPSKYVLKAGKAVKIWARNQGGVTNYVDSFVYEGDTNWGAGANVVTILYNKDGEERASCTQVLASSQVSTI